MHKLDSQKHSAARRALIYIPFALLILLMTAFFGGGLLFLFYAFVSAAAFKSAMIFMIVAGAALILAGAGLGLVVAYKKYYAFYSKKIGRKLVDENNKTKRIVTSDSSDEKPLIKRLFTVSNIALALLALGSVFSIISAALGCINRANWVEAIGDYKESKGYYADIKDEPLEYEIEDTSNGKQPIRNIVIDASAIENEHRDKQIVVVYSKENAYTPKIKISGCKKFDDDFRVYPSKDGTVTIKIGKAPERDTALDKLLFFVFNDYRVEKQIIIPIPEKYRGIIEVSEYDIVVDNYNPLNY